MRLLEETLLGIGMISLVFGIFLSRILSIEFAGFWVVDFIEGILYGTSLPLNLYYLVKKSKQLSIKL